MATGQMTAMAAEAGTKFRPAPTSSEGGREGNGYRCVSIEGRRGRGPRRGQRGNGGRKTHEISASPDVFRRRARNFGQLQKAGKREWVPLRVHRGASWSGPAPWPTGQWRQWRPRRRARRRGQRADGGRRPGHLSRQPPGPSNKGTDKSEEHKKKEEHEKDRVRKCTDKVRSTRRTE